MSLLLDMVAGMKPLSRRIPDVLDVLEDYQLLRDLLAKMDDADVRARQQWPRLQEPFFTVVDLPEIRTRACYIEVSWERILEASRAVTAAAEAYERQFTAAALHRSDLRALLRRQGLPDPADIHRDARYRHVYEPWWRRMFRNSQPPSSWTITTQRPHSDEFTFYCLNDPDPSAAVAFWRESTSA